MMRQEKIECECGNVYYFQSIRDEIICMKCGNMNPNNGEPIPEPTEELTKPENE